MATDKRKQQYKEATAKNKAKKEAGGFKRVYFWIKPEWKKDIISLINTLKGDAK